MIPIKSADRTRKEMQDLEAMAAKLREAARKLLAGLVRHAILKQIWKFGVCRRLDARSSRTRTPLRRRYQDMCERRAAFPI